MLCHQTVAAAFSPNHPSHALIPTRDPPKSMKHSIFTKYENDVAPFVIDDKIPDHRQTFVRNRIHTKAVSDYLNNASPNRVLNHRPPTINLEETTLSIQDR